MTQDLINQGTAHGNSLLSQSQKMKGTTNKLDKSGAESLKQSDQLITKIGGQERKNTIIIAFVISCCLAVLIYHYDFLGLGAFRQVSDVATPETSSITSASTEPTTQEEEEEEKPKPVDSPPLLSAKTSIASISISSDDIEEVKSKRYSSKPTKGRKQFETAYDKKMNEAFGDDDLVEEDNSPKPEKKESIVKETPKEVETPKAIERDNREEDKS